MNTKRFNALMEAVNGHPVPEDEVALCESGAGYVLDLAESGADANPRAPLLMNVALIRPGWGNKKDNHYYGREVLKRDAHVFEGVKMYATDHRPEERNVRTEVAVIKTCPVAFTDDGAPIAQVAVHDPDFAERARNRAKLGTLNSLECSILALGKTKKGTVDGRKANVVEAITSATSVDFVSRAGAGGHVLNLAESGAGVTAVYDAASGVAYVSVPLSEDEDEEPGRDRFNEHLRAVGLRQV